ncbi:DUF4177 domain-containing protein [Evansella sp. LMS18]|jgi:hypothetical protein|uniref:DUF4177 domain-containing protein n=1 Tax=Evansella sp. LMS18 TaxID=2924033 RepID=UPI0020D16EFD|nr:DUF4177 domain-containing protein [Evansella sp. LMS18]UTR12647.1 DUF4177 domain-containing protein [Evansella sp. LMS18]
MKKWEYNVHIWEEFIEEHDGISLAELLDEYGEEGWELVNIVPQTGSSNYDGQVEEISTSTNLLIFKRPL